MSSKLNVKSKGKDGRPKSSDRLRKKKDGTPEPSITPSQELGILTPTKNVIWNEEIQRLQIKQDDMSMAWPPRPPSGERPSAASPVKVTVKKVKKPSEENKPKPRMVNVAKPAPPDAPLKPVDYTGFAGPRYESNGHVVLHSLLGTFEDFHREASKRGEVPEDLPAPQADSNLSTSPTLQYEKKRRKTKVAKRSHDIRLNQDENGALINWQLRMLERKRQQGHISNLLTKAPEDLAMNQADNFRSVQEKRYLIDRSIPKVDYGKGYRVGSEFWFQQEQFGDDLAGLHMSLTQTQRGYPPPVEIIGLSSVVKDEKGCEWVGRQTPHLNYPWHRSEFLNKRQQQLQPFIDELAPFKPAFDGLQVIGSNVPVFRTMEETDEKKDEEKDEEGDGEMGMRGGGLSLGLEENEEDAEGYQGEMKLPGVDDQEKAVFGPSLLFGGQRAAWLGDSFSRKLEVGIEARVTFECLTGDRVTSYLELGNNGTTSIYYDWKKMSKENPFDLVQAQVQRFYFNNSSGVILPGEALKFPFVFKSMNAGVFTEQWKLETRPVVCAGAALLVTLRGVAIQEDKFKQQREQLEKELVERQANQVIQHLLYELVSGVRTPERARSPVDAYITEEEIFHRNNPGLEYCHETVSQLRAIHTQLFSEEERAVNVWSLSIHDLQDAILELDDDDETKKENLLHQMNEFVGKLGYTHQHPIQHRLQAAGHQLFLEAIDRMVGVSMLLRNQMGLPDREQDEIDGEMSNSLKGNRALDRGKPEVGKEKGKPAAKEVNVGGKGKQPKTDAKGKTTPGPSKKSASPSAKPSPATPNSSSSLGMTGASVPGVGAGAGGEKESAESLPSHPPSPEPGLGMTNAELTAAETFYKEVFSSQVYEILGDMADQMDSILHGIITFNPAVSD